MQASKLLTAFITIIGLAACESKIAPSEGSKRGDLQAGESKKLGRYCKKWSAPEAVASLPPQITKGSELTFPADAQNSDYVYVSNLSLHPDSSTIFSDSEFNAVHLIHLATGNSRVLKFDLPAAEQPKDVDTMMTGKCGPLLPGKNCLYLVDSNYKAATPAIFVVAEPDRSNFLSSQDPLDVELVKRVLLPKNFRVNAGALVEQKLVMLSSPLTEVGVQKATESDVFVVTLGELKSKKDDQTLVPKPFGYVPIAFTIVARLKKLADGFSLNDSENPEVLEVLKLLPEATRTKIIAVLDGDPALIEQGLDGLNNDEGIDPLEIFKKIDYKPGHTAGFLFVTGLTVNPEDEKTFIVQTLAGPIEFHFDVLHESPGYAQFASQSDKRFNFIDLGKKGLLAKMKSITYVPGTANTVWYSTERVPSYTSSAFTTETDGSVYARAPIMQMTCED